jgi:hypothetical protein
VTGEDRALAVAPQSRPYEVIRDARLLTPDDDRVYIIPSWWRNTIRSPSDFSELELLDHVFNAAYTPAATVYMALGTADSTHAGTGLAEPSGDGYARKAITFGAAASRRVTQSAAVTYDQATGAWGTIAHWAVMDALTSGNVLAIRRRSTAARSTSNS